MKKQLNLNDASYDVKAWLLDVGIDKQGLILWLKSENHQTFRTFLTYQPAFYAVISRSYLKSLPNHRLNELYKQQKIIIEENPNVYSVQIVKRRVKSDDLALSFALQIKTSSPFKFKQIISEIRQMGRFELYNTDIPIVQMFFYESHLFPFAFCSLTFRKRHRSQGSYLELTQILLNDSNEEIYYDLPPLKVVWLELNAEGSYLKKSYNDPLTRAIVTVDPCSENLSFDPLHSLIPSIIISQDEHNAPQLIIEEKNERNTLSILDRVISIIDPDVIFTSEGDEVLFPYLLARLSYLNMDRNFSLSRDRKPLKSTRFLLDGANHFMSYGMILHRSKSQFYLNGRLHIDSAIYGGLHFDDGNLYGIVEVARVSYSPIQRLTRVTIGGALQSLQFYHAYQNHILIPEEKKNAEHFHPSDALLFSDRGGHILQPKIGFFSHVAELDFTSMYPSLMVYYNVSSEAINCKCCKTDGIKVPGLDYHLCVKRKGIVPLSLEIPLRKRICYKKLSKSSNGKLAQKYSKMEGALKWILVVCFGYLGFRNARFGRIEAHQTVCAYSREFLLNAVTIVEKHGLSPIHGIVDSLYVQSLEAIDKELFDKKCKAITQEIVEKTHIPISYDPDSDYFTLIAFLPTKAHPEIGALNRYWGVKFNGSIKVRGIELRRHDAPPIVKKFQTDAIEIIGRYFMRDNFDTLFSEYLIPLLYNYYQYLEDQTAAPEELALTIRMTRRFDQYKVMNYQSIAATYLESMGVSVQPGQKISFLITNDKSLHPMERVIPLQLYDPSSMRYDIGKYKELLVRALNNLLPNPLSDLEKHRLISLWVRGENMTRVKQRTLLKFFN